MEEKIKFKRFESRVIAKCSRCSKDMNGGFYLQLFNRRDRTDRDNAFICDDCTDDLVKFMNGKTQ